MFCTQDPNDNGFITKDQFKELLIQFSLVKDKSDMEGIMGKWNPNTREINFNDFCKMLESSIQF